MALCQVKLGENLTSCPDGSEVFMRGSGLAVQSVQHEGVIRRWFSEKWI